MKPHPSSHEHHPDDAESMLLQPSSAQLRTSGPVFDRRRSISFDSRTHGIDMRRPQQCLLLLLSLALILALTRMIGMETTHWTPVSRQMTRDHNEPHTRSHVPSPALLLSLDRALWLLDVLTCLTSGLYVYRRDVRFQPALDVLRANASVAANIFDPVWASSGLRDLACMSKSAGCDEQYRYSHCHVSARMIEAMQWQWAVRRTGAADTPPMSLEQLEHTLADMIAWNEAESTVMQQELRRTLDAVHRRDFNRAEWTLPAWFTRYFSAWNETLADQMPARTESDQAVTGDASSASVAQNEDRDRRLVQRALDAQSQADRTEAPLHSSLPVAPRVSRSFPSVPPGGGTALSRVLSLLESESVKIRDARDPSRPATQVDQSHRAIWEDVQRKQGAEVASTSHGQGEGDPAGSLHCAYQAGPEHSRVQSSSWSPRCRACLHDPRQPRSFEFGGGSTSDAPSSDLINEAMRAARFSANLPDGSTRLPRPSLTPRFADSALHAPLPAELSPGSPGDVAHPPVYLSDLMPPLDAVRELQRHRVLFIGDSLAEQQRQSLGCASGQPWRMVLNVALIEPGEHQGRQEWAVTQPFKQLLPSADVLIIAVGPHLVRNIRYFSSTDLVATRKWLSDNARHTLTYLTQHWHGHVFLRPSGVGHPHCASQTAWDRIVHRRPQAAWSYARDADSPFLHWLHDTINETFLREMARLHHPRLHFVHFDSLQRPRLDGHVAMDSQAPRGERVEDCLHYCLPHPIYAHANAAIAVELKKIRIRAMLIRASKISADDEQEQQ